MVGAEERLAELVDDAGAAELGKRVARRPRRDDRAVGSTSPGRWWSVTTTSSPRCRASGDLLDRRDPAVDREDEPDTVVREPPERLARDAVALLEPARQMPVDVGSELAQEEDRERGRTDPVHVVVAVDADARACVDGRADALDRDRHVAEQQRIVAGGSASRKRRASSGSS